jgi:hypothetical protein
MGVALGEHIRALRCTASTHVTTRPYEAFIDMSKRQKSNKESKKQPLLTPKEKKAAKLAKKHAGDHVPLIVRTP